MGSRRPRAPGDPGGRNRARDAARPRRLRRRRARQGDFGRHVGNAGEPEPYRPGSHCAASRLDGLTTYFFRFEGGDHRHMTTHAQFYLTRAQVARELADGSQLDNVKESHLRAAEAWDGFAQCAMKADLMRAEEVKRKSAEA